MTVNYRRGFIRLWVLISVLWTAGVCLLYSSQIDKEIEQWRFQSRFQSSLMLPVRCSDARGHRGVELEAGICFFNQTEFRLLYPEYDDLTLDDLTQKLYASVGKPRTSSFYNLIREVSLFVIIPPIILLLTGTAFAWVGSGFFQKNP